MQKQEMKTVKLSEISVGKTNPRQYFDEAAMKELTASIQEKGVLQPVLIRPKGEKYELVAGERRYRAACAVNTLIKDRDAIPALIREMNDQEALEIQIIENLQRKDISSMEEAVGFKSLKEKNKMEIKEIGRRVGKTESYVALRLKLNELIEDFQKQLHTNNIFLSDCLFLCRLSPEDQKTIWKGIYDKRNFIRLGQNILSSHSSDLKKAPFNLEDAELFKEAGACSKCQFNSSINSSLFPELTNKQATCQKTACYKKKCELAFVEDIKKAVEEPGTILVHYNAESAIKKTVTSSGQKLYYKYDLTSATAKTPGAVKGFMLDSYDKGKTAYYVIPKKEKATAQDTKQAAKTGKLTISTINSEISRMKVNLSRRSEIAENGAQEEIYSLMLKEKEYHAKKEALSLIEKKALIIILLKELRSHGSKFSAEAQFKKLTGLSDDYNSSKLYKALNVMSLQKLNDAGNILARCIFLEALQPGNESRPQRCDKAAILRDIAKENNAKGFNEIISAMNEQSKEREDRVAQRAAKLRKELADQKTNKPELPAGGFRSGKKDKKKK